MKTSTKIFHKKKNIFLKKSNRKDIILKTNNCYRIKKIKAKDSLTLMKSQTFLMKI